MRVIVIMAGGAGERFWPMSRANHPKQLLTLTSSGQSLLAEAVERSKAIVPAENIYIATGTTLKEPIANANLGIPLDNIIAEPCKRNTAGCLIYASAMILAQNRSIGPEGVTMGILTADHRIPDTEPFVETVQAAMDEAEKHDSLVTVGIQPVRPESAYGYIEVEGKGKALNSNERFPLYKVNCFHEKPTVQEAAKYIASGNYYWNSGMFFWRLSSFQNEFGSANPVMAEALEDLTDALMAKDMQRAERIFSAMPNISIDYALMEKARDVSVIPGNFIWDDLGAWDSLERTFPHDTCGNISYGSPVIIDSENSIVYNAPGQKKMAVAVVGVKDLVVVVNEDAVLVIPKSRAQDVRKAVVALRDQKSDKV